MVDKTSLPPEIIIGPEYERAEGLGRLRILNEKTKLPQNRMRAAPTERRFRYWWSPGIFDQGQTSDCVGWGTKRYMLTGPTVNLMKVSPAQFVKLAQRQDYWPGENYEGTSVDAAFRVMRDQGYCSAWQWGDEAMMLARHILEVGPVLIGTDWPHNCAYLDEHGYMHASGENYGGHCTCLTGVNLDFHNPRGTVGKFLCDNSHGDEWGRVIVDRATGRRSQTGNAWIDFAEMQKLLDGLEGWPGEAGVATEIKVTA